MVDPWASKPRDPQYTNVSFLWLWPSEFASWNNSDVLVFSFTYNVTNHNLRETFSTKFSFWYAINFIPCQTLIINLDKYFNNNYRYMYNLWNIATVNVVQNSYLINQFLYAFYIQFWDKKMIKMIFTRISTSFMFWVSKKIIYLPYTVSKAFVIIRQIVGI